MGRSIRINNICLAFALATFSFVSPQAVAQGEPVFEGKLIQVDLFYRETIQAREYTLTQPVVVGPGIELAGFGEIDDPPHAEVPPLFDIDISDRQILITLVNDQPLALLTAIRFFDNDFAITPFIGKVSLNSATDWAGYTTSRVQVDNEAITVQVGGLQGLDGQLILLDVVPEPASAGMMVAGLLAVIARRRRARTA